jgi:hypothetical protein
VTGARAVLAYVSELATGGPTDLRAEAEAVRDALLWVLDARDIEAIRDLTRRAGALLQ